MKKEKILGFDVCNIQQEELLQNIYNDYKNNNQSIILSVNPEIILNNYRNHEYINLMNSQKYQIPDGIGIIYASKFNGGNIKKRITGIDLMNEICMKSINNNSKIFLYGSKIGVAQKAKEQLEDKYPGINIVGVCDGYVSEDDAIKKILKENPDILFVGLGSPKQEKFIIDNKENFKNIKILMPVGGSFDVISNNLKRAPNWMIKMNIEWLYRLIKQPKRIFRQIKLIKFIFYVILNKNKKEG